MTKRPRPHIWIRAVFLPSVLYMRGVRGLGSPIWEK